MAIPDSDSMDTLNRLIQKIAAQPSTEELILFIAGDKAMVKACLKLQKILDGSNGRDLAQIDTLCQNHHLAREVLSREVHRILAIFSPEAVDNEYAVLGLDPDATPKQIKQAFHRLSVQYHPDSSGSDTADKFIEICQAYKTIISRSETHRPGPPPPRAGVWRYSVKEEPVSRQKRNNIYFFAALAALLLLISLIAPFFFNTKVMRKNLNTADPIVGTQTQFPELPPTAPEDTGPMRPE